MKLPSCYWGVWRRTFLETGNVVDISSKVFWLQTSSWHADIRIPADRPDFAGITSLADCSAEQCAWLAKQQGFAGVTRLSGDQCEWKRVIDFQPQAGKRDIGRMRFENPNRLVECGVDEEYRELWERVADGSYEHCFALQLVERNHPASPASYLAVSGNHFIYLRDRPALPAQPTFGNANQLGSHCDLAKLLDFEISYGLLRGASHSWQIEMSTLPWREGSAALDIEITHVPVGRIVQDSNSGFTWRVLCRNSRYPD